MSYSRPTIIEMASDPEVQAALAKIPRVAALPRSVTVDSRPPTPYPCVRRGKIVSGLNQRTARVAVIARRLRELELSAESLHNKSLRIGGEIHALRKLLEEIE